MNVNAPPDIRFQCKKMQGLMRPLKSHVFPKSFALSLISECSHHPVGFHHDQHAN